jgi:intracellular multiplication protein IcmL
MADNSQDEVLTQVKLRNEFYRDNYRKIVGALLICIFIIFILIGGITYIITNPPQPQYFATTTNGRIIPLVPLDRPNLSSAALLQWANMAAISVYTYDFVSYRQALQAASDYFTPEGWQNFMQALQSSNNLNAVLAKKLVVSAVATGAPVILQQGLLFGTYTWRVQLPVLVTYQSASEFSQQTVTITMLITRVSTLTTPKGIGIAQFIVSGG